MTAPEFVDEVVTKALVRYLEVPGVPGEIALVTLDNGHDHTRPSTFGPAGLQSLSDALDAIEAHRPQVSAVAVTGKPFVFAVGADISGIGLIADREQALTIAQTGHRIFRRFKELPVPTFAAWNWRCTATTGRCRPRPPRSRFPSVSWAWYPAGVAPSCCRT